MPPFPSTPEPDLSPPYPNALRETRENKAMLSRAQLVAHSIAFAEREPMRYVRIGMTSLRDLELGLSRPRRSTAVTLGAILETPPEKLFPEGFDDPIHNPRGTTRITENHRKHKGKS